MDRLLILSVGFAALGLAKCQDGLSTAVFDAIDSENNGLSRINTEIWENPELAFEEVHAHKVLTDYLEELGFTVTRGAYNISTAFTAEFSNGEGRTVSFNAEYDALTGMGHACGHNLIATASVAAAIGVKSALEADAVKGKVVLIGTPAEENFGGKQFLIDAGAYDDVDCSLMGHSTGGGYATYAPSSAAWMADVVWKGLPAHAGASPWLGRNAMDGFVSAYTMAGLLRQQIQDTDRIHHIIKDSKQVINVIPELAASQWAVRSTTLDRREVLLNQVRDIIDSSARTTGTNVTIETVLDYHDVAPNLPLVKTFYSFMMEYFDPAASEETAVFTHRDPDAEVANPRSGGSTDQGNVSHKVPSIHVIFPITTRASVHTPGYTAEAGTPLAFRQAVRTGKTLAMTGIEVLRNSTLATEMWDYFRGE